MTDPGRLDAADLRTLDDQVVAALASGDESALKILGYGEISVALGWPADAPRFVCKRTPTFTPAQFADYRAIVLEYLDRLRGVGVQVVDTEVASVDRGKRVAGYLIQPMLDPATLGDHVLRASTPDAEHPFLVALADAMGTVSERLSMDAQVTNFSWDGDRLTLIDVGTPFLWDDTDRLRFDMMPFLRMLPMPVRPIVAKELRGTLQRWRDPRGVAVDIVANLFREGLPEWVDPTIAALNARVDLSSPITRSEARAFYDEDLETWPRLKKLQAVERAWQQKVRRRPYDFFIHSTFD